MFLYDFSNGSLKLRSYFSELGLESESTFSRKECDYSRRVQSLGVSKGEFQRAIDALVIFYKPVENAFQRTHNFKEHSTYNKGS